MAHSNTERRGPSPVVKGSAGDSSTDRPRSWVRAPAPCSASPAEISRAELQRSRRGARFPCRINSGAISRLPKNAQRLESTTASIGRREFRVSSTRFGRPVEVLTTRKCNCRRRSNASLIVKNGTADARTGQSEVSSYRSRHAGVARLREWPIVVPSIRTADATNRVAGGDGRRKTSDTFPSEPASKLKASGRRAFRCARPTDGEDDRSRNQVKGTRFELQ